MAKQSKPAAQGEVDRVMVRMYRAGTGDFFLLRFMSGQKVTFKLLIDCGCINGSKKGFQPLIQNLRDITDKEIDLLIVTHQHTDHYNGFDLGAEEFKKIVTT